MHNYISYKILRRLILLNLIFPPKLFSFVCVFCCCVYFVKLLQKAIRIYIFCSFFICLCEQSPHKLWYTQKKRFKSELENSSNLLSLSNGLLLLFRVGVSVFVCVLRCAMCYTGSVVMLSARWCPVARVGLVEGVLGKEVGVIFLHFAWAERGLLGKSSAFLVLQFTLLLDFRRWPFLISAHIATALINSSNWLGLVDRCRFLRHWRFAA